MMLRIITIAIGRGILRIVNLMPKTYERNVCFAFVWKRMGYLKPFAKTKAAAIFLLNMVKMGGYLP